MVTETEFIRRLALKGNPRWTKDGWEKEGWEDGQSKWNLQEAKEVFDAFIETMIDCFENGENVNLRGFGKFEIRQTKSRKSVDFKKGVINIPSHKRVHFTQGKTLRRIIDKCDDGGDE